MPPPRRNVTSTSLRLLSSAPLRPGRACRDGTSMSSTIPCAADQRRRPFLSPIVSTTGSPDAADRRRTPAPCKASFGSKGLPTQGLTPTTGNSLHRSDPGAGSPARVGWPVCLWQLVGAGTQGKKAMEAMHTVALEIRLLAEKVSCMYYTGHLEVFNENFLVAD
ncbi:hypothetical protein EJB05_01135, partial [Eragrostis curvula]